MIGGTWNFLRIIETTHEKVKDKLIDFVLDCETVIGIVAEPDFTETDKRATFTSATLP
jgi:hypothetical protein